MYSQVSVEVTDEGMDDYVDNHDISHTSRDNMTGSYTVYIAVGQLACRVSTVFGFMSLITS